jgi:hypothetical protein
MQPNKENIRKWVDALRSGKFVQGKGVLHRKSGEMCCLGIACYLAAQEGIVSTDEYENHVAGACITYDAYPFDLPESVRAWLGVESSNPNLQGCNASGWNDDRDKTFAQIADLIEAEYLSEAVS